jgi:hypothetical protein
MLLKKEKKEKKKKKKKKSVLTVGKGTRQRSAVAPPACSTLGTGISYCVLIKKANDANSCL